MGIKGELIEPMEATDFFDFLKDKFELKYIRHSIKLNKQILKVSIVVGSGSFAIKNSLDSGVDEFITTELNYHNFYEADDKAILVDIGHYET